VSDTFISRMSGRIVTERMVAVAGVTVDGVTVVGHVAHARYNLLGSSVAHAQSISTKAPVEKTAAARIQLVSIPGKHIAVCGRR
jgi:hypothetical protein